MFEGSISVLAFLDAIGVIDVVRTMRNFGVRRGMGTSNFVRKRPPLLLGV